jgi:hypothetical protein
MAVLAGGDVGLVRATVCNWSVVDIALDRRDQASEEFQLQLSTN